MSTVEEVTTAVRQVAAHEARFAALTERIDEMWDHLDQAGLRSTGSGGTDPSRCVREVHARQGDDARQLQLYRSHDILGLGVQDVELLECWGLRALWRHPGVDRAGTG